MVKYRFFINEKPVDVVYEDGNLKLDYELETNQKFFRSKLNAKLRFIRKDFDYLNGMPFDTVFKLLGEKSNDNGKTWNFYYKGQFKKTDCDWDLDNKMVTVTPDYDDEYTDVLAGYEKEYDLISAAPPMTSLIMQKRPLIQMYCVGDNTLSNFVGGTWWQQDCAVIDGDTAVNNYHFKIASLSGEVLVNMQNGTPKDMAGLYVGNILKVGTGIGIHEQGWFYSKDAPDYYVHYEEKGVFIGPNIYTFQFIRISDNVVLFENTSVQHIKDTTERTISASGPGATGQLNFSTNYYFVVMRLLLDREYINGEQASRVPDDDITDNSLNYRYVIGYDDSTCILSDYFSNEPTQWGKSEDGRYFLPPEYFVDPEEYRIYPIARTLWRRTSLWFRYEAAEFAREPSGRSPFTLRYVYPLAGAIQAVLKQFSGIKHEETEEYSQFLYGSINPITKISNYRLMITPKSNVLHGDLDQPAQKAPCTFRDFMDMLRDTMRLYWFIEDGKLKIEHVNFFRNGGTYDEGTKELGIDLTKLLHPRHNKSWAFGRSKWTFDKVNMPQRYEFSWMDDCTEAFDGFPIEMLSPYVEDGKIEDVNISKFSTDIDYLLMNSSNVSQDGFALLASEFQDIIASLGTVNIENGYIDADGTVKDGSGVDQDGKGWYNMILPVASGNAYSLWDKTTNLLISGVYWHLYDSNKNSLGRYPSTGSTVVSNAINNISVYYIGLSWRGDSDSVPNTFPVLDYRKFSLRSLNRSIPFLDININGRLLLQNGVLSNMYLHPTFYVYDLPARKVKINEIETESVHVDLGKKQVVKYPSIEDPDTSKLIKTYLGNGVIEKISINLDSRMNEITLKYETDL